MNINYIYQTCILHCSFCVFK